MDPTRAGPPRIEPPCSEAELSARVALLAGVRLGALAAAHGVAVPADALHGKGFAGQLLERALGATAGSRAVPDFPGLGVELKSVPVGRRGQPLESCFVASLELAEFDRRWETSAVRKKLLRVLWVPIEAARQLPLAERRIGAGRLWSPSAAEEAALRDDYEELVELLDEGFGARVTGHRGRVLQLRPKGRDAGHLRWALDEEGAPNRMAPRAFYLRPSFTAALLGASQKPQRLE